MMLRASTVALAFVAIAAGSARAQGQAVPPLAEVARKAEAAKPTVRKATRTYTNADLASDPRGEPTTPPPADDAGGVVSKSPGKPVPAGELVARSEATVESDAIAKQSEETWRMRADSLRQQVAQLQETLKERTTPNALRDASPALKTENDKAVANLRSALDGLRKNWARFEASAREVKIPIAWIEPLPQFPQ